MTNAQKISRIVIFQLITLLMSAAVHAQCTVCTQTAESLEPNAAKGLNMGIVYLAMLPSIIIAVIAFQFYKKSKQ